MAKAKLNWDLRNNNDLLVATILETNQEVLFDLTRLTGWVEFKAAAEECAVGWDSFVAGMQKKLAQPCGGTTNPVKNWSKLMEALFTSVVESNSYAQRKTAAESVGVSDVFSMAEEMECSEEEMELLKSLIGKIRAKK